MLEAAAASSNLLDEAADGRIEIGDVGIRNIDVGDVDVDAADRLGRYQLRGELGRGGMGIVYKADDPTLDRSVALKLIPSTLLRDAERRERFSKEAKLLAAVKHPRIATVYSMEEEDGVRFITMELMEGESLADRLRREGALPLLDCLNFGEQIALALEAAHATGVVHRDLKPSNIQVLPDGRIKVFDFGLAASTDEASSGSWAGTPGYMSPERIRGRETGPEEDLWALGCLIFECLSGCPAFLRDELAETVRATVQESLSWESLPTQTPEPIRALLERALSPSPDRKPVTASEFAEVFREEWRTREESLRFRRNLREEDDERTTLPAVSGRFVGRVREINELARLLDSERHVTVVAGGGCGKTRLSIETAREIADRFDKGVCFALLASIVEPAMLHRAVASALGLDGRDQDLLEDIVEHVGTRSLLLVLDNCEHLQDSVKDFVDEILPRCPGLRVLATSRRSLGPDKEQIFPLSPLPVPESESATLDSIAHVETVRLFLDRADRAAPGFRLREEDAATLARICVQLEGVPLAVELAASRVRMLSLGQIEDRLSDRLRVLSRGSSEDARHRSLRAALDWSYDQLPESERALLRRLSVFRGGCSLEQVEAVCSDDDIHEEEILDGLAELVDASLVTTVGEFADTSLHSSLNSSLSSSLNSSLNASLNASRYELLETVRQYGTRRLEEAGESARFLGQHRDYFAGLSTRFKDEFQGPKSAETVARCSSDHDNLFAAFRHAVRDTSTQPDVAYALGAALGSYWDIRGYNQTGLVALDSLLKAEHLQIPSVDRSRVLGSAGVLCINQGNYTEAKAKLEESRRLSREFDFAEGEVRSLHNLAICASFTQDFEEARKMWESALAIARRLGLGSAAARTLNSLGVLADMMGDDETARRHYEDSLAIKRKLGNPRSVAITLANLGQIAARTDRPAARRWLEESIQLTRDVQDDANLAFALRQLGGLERNEGNFEAARNHLEEALSLVERIGERVGQVEAHRNLCLLEREAGRLGPACMHAREALQTAEEIADHHEVANNLVQMVHVLIADGQWDEASFLLGGLRSVEAFVDTRITADLVGQMERIESQLAAHATEDPAFDAASFQARGRELSYGEVLTWVREVRTKADE